MFPCFEFFSSIFEFSFSMSNKIRKNDFKKVASLYGKIRFYNKCWGQAMSLTPKS